MTTRRRGQPLMLLVALLFGWASVRAMVWQAPFELGVAEVVRAVAFNALAPQPSPYGKVRGAGRAAPVIEHRAGKSSLNSEIVASSSPLGAASFAVTGQGPRSMDLPGQTYAARIDPAQQLLFIAGLGYVTLAEQDLTPRPVRAMVPLYPGRSAPAGSRRWSGDAWVLVRGGPAGLGAGGGTASYGGSQAGAVLRYRLSAGSPFRPAGYVRVSGSFGPLGGDDRELSAGFAFRPLADVPIAALAEGRVRRGGGRTTIRPAVALVSEFAPLHLPFGSSAEIYAQAGYVGGEGATAFADGQAIVDRLLIKAGDKAEVRIGGGTWGGAQRGASRVDVGPRITVRTAIGGVTMRAAADWRIRVAGGARPGSGPALTLSAGF